MSESWIQYAQGRLRTVQARNAAPPDSSEWLLRTQGLADLDSRLRAEYGPTFCPEFRQLLATGAGIEVQPEVRAISSGSSANVQKYSFVNALMGAVASKAPLFRDCLMLVTGENGNELDFSAFLTQPTISGIVTMGSALTASDPTFTGRVLSSFKYPAYLQISSESVSDAAWDIESWAVQRLAPQLAFKIEDAFLNGAGSTSTPEGILAGLSSVTAASASTVVVDDIANLLSNVPEQYLDETAIYVSTAAWHQLNRQTLGTSAAGGQAWAIDSDHNTMFGFPIYRDAALASPSTGVVTAFAGDASTAYIGRSTTLRVEMGEGRLWNQELLEMRAILRADGRRTVTDAMRKLTMA